MQTKTFKANSTIETLQLVQSELGADAIVVSMREVPAGPIWNPWKKSNVEVVAAAQKKPALRKAQNPIGVEFVEEMPEIEWDLKPTKKSAGLPPPLKMNLSPLPEKTASKPDQRVDSVIRTDTATPKSEAQQPSSLKKIQAQLIQQGVDPALVENILNLAQETLSPSTLADVEACKRSIIQLMGAELRVQKGAGAFVASHVVCVVGASGNGKTSAIAKLAVQFKQSLNKNIVWVCADTVRMGATAEAKAYADALGVDFKLVYTPQDLKQILNNAQANDLFLVDTPGYNPRNEKQMVELGSLLSEMPNRCTYLVVPATFKEADLFQAAASYGVYKIDGLIITKLDETHVFGSLYNMARKNQMPLAYFISGRETSHNLEAADPARLVSAIFGKDWNK